ncbi:hypothetical protein [Aneurinibacillus tyrosinisolvens]|uniref:hypothetical protein n=1 Tax=Aneurinibacillus tyrosinisolvens TaxID=1443435 RepID=UPI00063F7BC2|nr:hypothetical protein [Aneurinibacillus tyrosinisolvens]
MNQISMEHVMLIGFYKKGMSKAPFPGYVDSFLQRIVNYGTPNLLTERGHPILARYNGLSLVMLDSGYSEWHDASCGTVQTVSTEEYFYIMHMYRFVKNENAKLNTYERPICGHCKKAFENPMQYGKHIRQNPDCREHYHRNRPAVTPASPICEIKQKAMEEYQRQPFKQGVMSY